MPKNLLIVEDDLSIAEMMSDHLNKEGYQIFHAMNGIAALERFSQGEIDLILLDLMLPELDGTEFLKAVRTQSFVPVLIVSAKDSELDKALGLGFGADDYITKPFSLIELSARVKASLRRATVYAGKDGHSQQPHPQLRVHELSLDPELHTVSINGSAPRARTDEAVNEGAWKGT
ncbi:response regulator [Candidatus Pristimantibacillus sp. PTI5]|uniref:response regulator n=1 Tax=Candidatus Pristimantibacillus sp. PTI5 TaxID=3400422 RepID=UPI003B02B75D